jgi:HAMP domain-containing protein
VSDGATPYLLKSNPVGLRELLRKYGSRPDLAYIVVEDRARKVFAHSLPVLPDEIENSARTPNASRETRLLRLGDDEVYEVAAPVLEGRGGSVRVGVWRERIDQEIRATLMPLMSWLLGLTLAGVLLAMFLAWRINRPIFRLVSAAKAISSGDLDRPTPNVGDKGEFAELSRAIERLRSSVKAAMVRLSR